MARARRACNELRPNLLDSHSCLFDCINLEMSFKASQRTVVGFALRSALTCRTGTSNFHRFLAGGIRVWNMASAAGLGVQEISPAVELDDLTFNGSFRVREFSGPLALLSSADSMSISDSRSSLGMSSDSSERYPVKILS